MPESTAPLHYFYSMEDFLTPAALREVKKLRITDEYEAKLFKVMERHEKRGTLFAEQATCMQHGTCGVLQAMWADAETPSTSARKLKLVVAGTTCTAWSSRGLSRKEADETMRPFMIWLFLLRQLQPDLVVHECTSRFRAEIFQKYLGSFDWRTVQICPRDLGWPVHRSRRYTVLCNSNTTTWQGGPDLDCLNTLFSASVELEADSLYCASATEIEAEKELLLRRRKVQPGLAVSDWADCYTPLTQRRPLA